MHRNPDLNIRLVPVPQSLNLIKREVDIAISLEPSTQRALPPGHELRDTQALHEQWRQRHAKGGMLQDYHAPGCDHCGSTGYMGRLALHELLIATPAVRQLVQQRARPAEILALALSEGMRSLRQDGIEKVLAGLSSLAEVRASTND